MSLTQTTSLRARDITDTDLPAVASLLARGLGYSCRYFSRILDRISRHATPPGFPKYGRLLECDGKIVGAILLIFSVMRSGPASSIRCHVTSWYVEPPFRCFAGVFFAAALNYKDVTYINISARSNALPIIEMQRFVKYASGQFVALPLLHLFSRSRGDIAEVIGGERVPNGRFEPFERDLLATHAEYGCVSVWCVASGSAYPFVFHRRALKRFLPGAQLVYCRDIKDFVRFARPLGRFLAARGIFVVSMDSNGPIGGLAGKYYEGIEPRYYKGGRPRLGDLAFTQRVMDADVRRGSDAENF